MWARQHADVRGLALVGSRVRGCARSDSDFDFVVLTRAASQYLEDDERFTELGAVRIDRPRAWGVLTERRLFFSSGPSVELGFADPSWAATDPVDAGTRRVVSDGMRILDDPDGLLKALSDACGVEPTPAFPEELTLRGGGLLLRDWSDEDASALRTICGDPDVCRFTSVPGTYSPDAARAWVGRIREQRLAGNGIALAILAPGAVDVIGNVNLVRFSPDRREAALGYWLVPVARGKGYATAATRVLCTWGFEELGLRRIELAILPTNRASRRVAERLNARHEGLRRDSHEAEGRPWDMEIYTLKPARDPCHQGDRPPTDTTDRLSGVLDVGIARDVARSTLAVAVPALIEREHAEIRDEEVGALFPLTRVSSEPV